MSVVRMIAWGFVDVEKLSDAEFERLRKQASRELKIHRLRINGVYTSNRWVALSTLDFKCLEMGPMKAVCKFAVRMIEPSPVLRELSNASSA